MKRICATGINEKYYKRLKIKVFVFKINVQYLKYQNLTDRRTHKSLISYFQDSCLTTKLSNG